MNGMANVISAKGNYNLSTSAAAINMTQAQKNEIQNAQLYTDTYFQMRATNKAARQAEAGPPPTIEQLARIAREGAPKPVTTQQVNPMSGQISWPARADARCLQAATRGFGTDRHEAGQIRRTELFRSDASPKNHRDHVRRVEDARSPRFRRKITPRAEAFLNSMIYATSKSQLQ